MNHVVNDPDHRICLTNRAPEVRRRLSLFVLLLCIGLTGCKTFLAEHAVKTYPAKIQPVEGLRKPNAYQQDFLFLKTVAEEVVPLLDHSFPADKRAVMERKFLEELGQPGCTRETFLVILRRYLAAFNNAHAYVAYNPKEIRLPGYYAFTIHYVSNDVYIAGIGDEYDRSLIGQKITAINGQAIAKVEAQLCSLMTGENSWTKKKSLEPGGYSVAGYYKMLGLSSSISNSLQLEFADHPPVSLAPIWKTSVGVRGISNAPHPVTARSRHSYDCRIFPEQNFAYFQFNACFDKTAVLDGIQMVKPWIRPLVRAWIGIQFHRRKPAAVLDGIYDSERPVFKEYLASAIRDINRHGITNLIIDVRRNRGGEGALCDQLIYHLTPRTDLRRARRFEYYSGAWIYYEPRESREYRAWYRKEFGAEPPLKQLLPAKPSDGKSAITDSKSLFYVAPDRPVFPGRVIVLANQNTISAAASFVQDMQDNRLALIVGTTTGSNPTGPTGMTPFKLPHSHILVSLPTEYYERAEPSNGDVLQPDYWVENSMADLKSGRDAAFEKALELLQRN